MQAQEFLAARRRGTVSGVTPLGKGAWSRAFAFEEAGHSYVVRFGAYNEDFEKDRLAARYASTELPIPQIIEIGEALGGYYAVAERVTGSYLDDVDGTQMLMLLPALFRAFDAMRQADLSTTSGYGGWNSAGNAPFASWRATLLDVANDRPTDRVHGWRERMASVIDIGLFDEAYARLQVLAERVPDDRHLIHSDLLHWNVLVDGSHITGVLDWGCGLYGDMLYDLAWFCFWQPWYPAWRGIDFRGEALKHYAAVGLDVPMFDERLLACELHIALGGMAYQAFAGHWDDLQSTAERTLSILRG